MDAELLEDFGQRVDLTRRIREVLANYPEGTTVLKELVQNADDAGATKICLCLDRRRHGTSSLLSPELAQWQGPALLAYNDAVFSEEDFVSISRIGGSKKQGQAWKTGRFGVGFNSVYHLTDLPSFVSGKYVVFFDPQRAYLPNISASNPGKRLEYVSSSAMTYYKDQFIPYCAFGCDMISPFQGTLFRFPLRDSEQAAVSKLSKQSYLEDDISSLFSQLYLEAALTLLFLKNVCAIEMYIWDSGMDEPHKVYSSSINSIDEDIIWHRQALLRFSSLAQNGSTSTDSFFFELQNEEFLVTHTEKNISKIFIVQSMAMPTSKVRAFAAAAKEYDLHLLPWASVAACISTGSVMDDAMKQGRAFCFLPLPVRTGLTVQINGYFEVSSNRRSIWYGDDMDRGGKLRSDWNKLLLEEVVAPLFGKLLLSLREQLGPSQLYYSFWPSDTFEEPWNHLVGHIYRNLCHLPVVHTELENGDWLCPVDVFFPDKEFYMSSNLSESLLLVGMPIVHLEASLVEILSQYLENFSKKVVNPVNVRSFLKSRNHLVERSRRCDKLMLLEYCISDLVDEEVGIHAKGLPLLPLANGEFGTLAESSRTATFFICNEVEFKLLEQVSTKMIDRHIPSMLFDRLSAIAKTSRANISMFNVHYLLELLPSLFHSDWKLKNRVSWPADSGENIPTRSWFLLFWRYLHDQCDGLSIFEEWPIFPSTSGHLYRGSKSSKLINMEKLPDILKNLLLRIGCKVLSPDFGVAHPELDYYVYNADGPGVVNAIFQCVSSSGDIQLLFHDVDEKSKNALREFLLDTRWYYEGIFDDCLIDHCKKMPIYRTFGGGLAHSFHFSDLESTRKYLPPVDVPEFFLSDEFIHSSSSREDEILQRYYRIKRMEKTSFYRENILVRVHELAPEVRDAVMLGILRDLPQLCLSDPTFKEQLQSLKFVPTVSGSLKSPPSLYDPRMEELYALLEDSECFPSGLYADSSALDMLRGLGLRTSVSCETVIASARQIEHMMHKDQLKAHSRGKVLLSYLEVNAMKWLYNSSAGSHIKVNRMFSKVVNTFKTRDIPDHFNLEKFWNDLRLICWCPVLLTAPNLALPWPSVSSMVAPPKLVRLPADLWLVSASMRILDGDCSSSALSSSLGWSSPPGGSVVAAQLLELGKNNEIVTDQALRQELTLTMPRIYSLLMSLIGSDEMDLVKAVLEGSRWVWVGDGFATVNEVVLNGHLYLAPYIRVIPIDLAVFSELFIEMGVRENLLPVDYVNILSRMASRKAGSPLNGQELRTSISVLQHLAELQSVKLDVEIYLPDASSRLLPAKELVFNDAPWLTESGDSSIRGTGQSTSGDPVNVCKYVHGNISNDVAERLGVRSLRRLMLMESSDSMNVSLSGVAEAFGQHEALTTRLKHIVEMYADGPGILFELVQNAEDAGASEVVFLLDETQYGTSSILSPEMAEWQGPALYCFNNSVFSSQDLYAISRIGQDSKVEKPLAIGRFGLGFNCVYHFTDVPGFVSGENIVIFDPHASYLPGISPSHPGLRIRYSGRRILEQFPDQFTPFLHFGCDLLHPYPGTLFRFPLRGESAASRSQIKREKYSPENVKSLFAAFSEVVPETLLFLRKINKISVYVKKGLDHEMQLIQSFSRNNIIHPKNELHPLHSMFSFLHGNQKSGINKEQFYLKLGKTLDKDLPWNCEKVIITEKTLSSERSHVWMLSECVAGGHAKIKSLSTNDRSCNLIPWACVAAYIYSSDLNSASVAPDAATSTSEHYLVQNQTPENLLLIRNKFSGRAFCFLPLPVHTGLPVHLNAYFELSSNRRDIWFGNDMAGGGKIRSDWNICLLEDAVAPAYAHLLEVIALEFGPCDLFFSLWPVSMSPEPWASVVKMFYMCINDLGLRVFYTHARGGQWIAPKQAIFPDSGFPKINELSEALSVAGLPMVSLPRSILEKVVLLCSSIRMLSPRLLRTLVIRRQRDFKDKSSTILVLEYCLSDMNGSSCYDDLHGLPLVPLSSGSFATFNKQGVGERIFVSCNNGYDLLKYSFPHLVVDHTITEVVLLKLVEIAQSASTNLSLLTPHSLLEFFPRILPTEWQQAKLVSWTPGEQGHPTVDWMLLLWNYLRLSCTDLSIFQSWPILPVENGCLVQLTRNSNVVKDDGWSENMSSLLQNLGCLRLRLDLHIEHPQLKDFVQDSTLVGILNALHAVAAPSGDFLRLFANVSEGEKRELRGFLFQSKWFSGNSVDSYHIDMIKKLPIYEAYHTRTFTALTSSMKWLKPIDMKEDLLDDSFIRTETEREKDILRIYFGIREPAKIEFYKDYILNNMQNFISQPDIIFAILMDVKVLVEEDVSMKSLLSKIPFVLSANGSWTCPSRLYDPRVIGLKTLLHRKAFFPDNMFSNPEILDTLSCLGLQKTLDFDGLLDCARSTSLYDLEKHVDTHIYAQNLLKCLTVLGSRLSSGSKLYDDVEGDQHGLNDLLQRTADLDTGDLKSSYSEENTGLNFDELLGLEVAPRRDQEDSFWAEMKKICWCPVYIDPPIQGIPWFQSNQQVASPNMTRPKSQMWVVSSTMRILNGECSSYVQNKLGWMDPLPIRVLSTQLVELSKAYILHSDPEILNTELQREVPRIYSKLQEFMGTEEFSFLKGALSGISWVWVGDNFISPMSLAFDSPVKYHPYLYVVPSELTEFKDLLLELGVKFTFGAMDYLRILLHLENDFKGKPLSAELLSFVRCVLEAICDCSADKQSSEGFTSSLLVPDSSGILRHLVDVIYNDAPWMERNTPASKYFVHQIITDDLAQRLGVQSLRSLSLVDENMIVDLPCMGYAQICELLALYGESSFLFFDLLELADCCKAKKVHLIYDKREHPRLSLLQKNLGEFQGPAIVAVIEGASLSRDEICSLQFRPPWNIKGTTLNYGLGLLGCHFVSDFLSVVSSGYLYMFDPLGLALSPPSTNTPTAKMFSLTGTDITKRFQDQFNPMLIFDDVSLTSSSATIIRMPLSSKCMTEIGTGGKKFKHIFDRFMERASPALLFMKSILQVCLWSYEIDDLKPSMDFSVSIDSSSIAMRNPFEEKKWRKFHLSRLFGTSSAATKLQVIDLHVDKGGIHVIDKWVTALSLGSGQTRNMALDRKYLAYNLTPLAGVAVHISEDNQPLEKRPPACILSPLPLSGDLNMPVIALGCFLVCHNGGRYLFNRNDISGYANLDMKYQLTEAWNRELMSCIRDSYVELVLEFQKLRRNPLTSAIDPSVARTLSFILKAYGDKIYMFWPRSKQRSIEPSDNGAHLRLVRTPEADWQCLVEQVIRPFYVCLVDLPVWQLYHGDVVKANEGMFLSHSTQLDNYLPPPGVCSFIREHYPVFAVPSELVNEIQAVGVRVREIKPKMVRNLLKSSSPMLLRSLDMYIDVLEYCMSDIELQLISNLSGYTGENTHGGPMENTYPHDMHRNNVPSSSNSYTERVAVPGNDALEIMSSFGKALYDFGRGVVEDIGRSGGPLTLRYVAAGESDGSDQTIAPIIAELKGMPLPTAKLNLARLGIMELWIGNKEQQLLMQNLEEKFVHPQCLERPILSNFFISELFHYSLKLKPFTPQLLSANMRHMFSATWINHIESKRTPWVSWENRMETEGGGPSSEWIKLFWKVFKDFSGDLSGVQEWPLIPAFLGGRVLCRPRHHNLIFVPPIMETSSESNASIYISGNGSSESIMEDKYLASFQMICKVHPWLCLILERCNIPVYDMSFMNHGAPLDCFPALGKTLGQVIAGKLLASKRAGYLSEPNPFPAADRDNFFGLFALDFGNPEGSRYTRDELDVLCDLPIYKTTTGSHTKIRRGEHCFLSSDGFFHPKDDRCLASADDGASFLRALGVSELHDHEVLVKFALPGFKGKTSEEQEDILIYLSVNWKDILLNSSVINTLKETQFVRNSAESAQFFKPSDLFDPCDSLLSSIFSTDKDRFPGERFFANEWLEILRKTGLRKSSEPDVIIECARKVELLGSESSTSVNTISDVESEFFNAQNEVSSSTWALAEALVGTIFANFSFLFEKKFCDVIGKVKFVPAEKGFPSIGGKSFGKRILCSYEESILLKDWPLAWSSAPILSKRNVIPPEYSWGALHLRTPPVFSTVLKHLQVVGRNNGEDTLAHWPTSVGILTVEEATCEILKFLDKIWGSLSSSDVSELRQVAFLPVANGTRLVTISSLFARLTFNLSPFAFELPACYLPHVKILKELGMLDSLTIEHAKDLLLAIQKSCGYQRLNPNELRAVMEILHFICEEGNPGRTDKDLVPDAVVPDDGCRLVLARVCVYIDTYGLKFISSIDCSRLRFTHPDIPESICLALGIKKLSDIVVEEVDNCEEVQILHNIRSVAVDTVAEKLRSTSLQEALWVIIKNVSNQLPFLKSLNMDQIHDSLEHMARNLQFVKYLHTRFLLLPNSIDITKRSKNLIIPEWEGTTRHRSLYFVDKTRTCILVAEPPSYISLYDVLAIVVSQVLNFPVILPVGSLFSSPCNSEEGISNVLRLGSEARATFLKDKNTVCVGKELLPQDALQVQLHPLRPFYAGELVAWKMGLDGEKLKYGRVPQDVRPSAGQALYRLSVETAPGDTKILLSSQVFSFRSVSLDDSASSASSTSSSQAGLENKHQLIAESSSSQKPSAVQHVPQHGKVSAAELVKAVHDMLSVAGVQLDTEKQGLLERTLTLQEKLEEAQVALLVEQEKAETATKEAEAAKTAWSCRICLSAEVCISIVPCGHVLCSRCASAVSRCPFCRTQVSQTLKIYRHNRIPVSVVNSQATDGDVSNATVHYMLRRGRSVSIILDCDIYHHFPR